MELFTFAECAIQASAADGSLTIDEGALVMLKLALNCIEQMRTREIMYVSTISTANLPYCELHITHLNPMTYRFLETVGKIKAYAAQHGGEYVEIDRKHAIARFKIGTLNQNVVS